MKKYRVIRMLSLLVVALLSAASATEEAEKRYHSLTLSSTLAAMMDEVEACSVALGELPQSQELPKDGKWPWGMSARLAFVVPDPDESKVFVRSLSMEGREKATGTVSLGENNGLTRRQLNSAFFFAYTNISPVDWGFVEESAAGKRLDEDLQSGKRYGGPFGQVSLTWHGDVPVVDADPEVRKPFVSLALQAFSDRGEPATIMGRAYVEIMPSQFLEVYIAPALLRQKGEPRVFLLKGVDYKFEKPAVGLYWKGVEALEMISYNQVMDKPRSRTYGATRSATTPWVALLEPKGVTSNIDAKALSVRVETRPRIFWTIDKIRPDGTRMPATKIDGVPIGKGPRTKLGLYAWLEVLSVGGPDHGGRGITDLPDNCQWMLTSPELIEIPISVEGWALESMSAVVDKSVMSRGDLHIDICLRVVPPGTKR